MALKSMTGFGRCENNTPSGLYHIEIRGVNNRFLEIQLRIPKALNILEARLKKAISQQISRGSVQVTLSWDQENEAGHWNCNKAKAGEFIKVLNDVRSQFKLADQVTLDHLLTVGDIITLETTQHSEQTLWNHIAPLLNQALADFQKHRESEARILERDLRKMVAAISKILTTIEKRAPVRLKKVADDLRKRIETLINDSVDPLRMHTEIALMADRLDIAEECTRLRAHIERFLEDLAKDEPVGKRLGFLLQEMNREANTIGSKANDTPISHSSVELKELIEKIREQIQNIE